jgi:hypothetical protein
MKRYLNSNPAHIEFLDMARLDVGWRLHFFGMKVEDIDAVPATASTRAKHAVQEALSRLERLAKDSSKTDDAKHEAAKVLFGNVKAEVSKSVDSIRAYGEREAEQARDRAFAVLAPDSAKASVYAEVRQYCREQTAKGDPDWPTRLSELCRTDLDTARAVNAAPAYLSGISDERRLRLVTDALEAFAPEDTAAVQHAVAVAREADHMEAGLRKLEQAMFTSTLADRSAASRVDVTAPLVPAAE